MGCKESNQTKTKTLTLVNLGKMLHDVGFKFLFCLKFNSRKHSKDMLSAHFWKFSQSASGDVLHYVSDVPRVWHSCDFTADVSQKCTQRGPKGAPQKSACFAIYYHFRI